MLIGENVIDEARHQRQRESDGTASQHRRVKGRSMSEKSIKALREHLEADFNKLLSISSIIHIIVAKISNDDEDQGDFPYIVSSLTLIEDLLKQVSDSLGHAHLDLHQLEMKYEPGESGGEGG